MFSIASTSRHCLTYIPALMASSVKSLRLSAQARDPPSTEGTVKHATQMQTLPLTAPPLWEPALKGPAQATQALSTVRKESPESRPARGGLYHIGLRMSKACGSDFP